MTPQTETPRTRDTPSCDDPWLSTDPWLSIVVPLKNEAENLDFVTEGIVAACAALAPYEVIYVDDGSTDETAARVLALHARFPQVRLVQHERSAGQSAAIHSGVLAARGSVICTLDGDGQNPPSEIPKLAAELQGRAFPEGVALIAGQRVGRQDTPSKRLASRAANGLRARLLKDETRDTGCGLKIFAATSSSPCPISITCTATSRRWWRGTAGRRCTSTSPTRRGMRDGRTTPTSVARGRRLRPRRGHVADPAAQEGARRRANGGLSLGGSLPHLPGRPLGRVLVGDGGPRRAR